MKLSWKERIRNAGFRKQIRKLFNIILILVFFYLAFWTYRIQDGIRFPHIFTRDIFEYPLITVYCQIIYYVLVKKRFRTILFWISMMILSLVAMAIYKTYDRSFSYNLGGVGLFNWGVDDFVQYIGYGTLLYFMFIFIDNLHILVDNDYTKTKKALKEAENKLLRQQFNPHFLYNAFNSLYSMSLQNHKETSNTILKLSGMMRYLTDEVNTSKVPLARELKFISEYIEVERIRFGKEANIDLSIDGDPQGKLIEPLVLIILVENAFKHGFYINNTNAFVHIDVNINDTDIRFSVKNSILKKQSFQKNEDNRNGKGLELLKKRLELAYHKNYSFDINNEENDIFHVYLKMPVTV